jgi:Cu-Zn family superoxide dismutase
MHTRKLIPLALVALTVFLVGGQLFQNAPASTDTTGTTRLADTVNAPEEVAAVIINQERRPIGLLRMQPGDDGMVNVLVVARGIEPGFHAVHIHETGQCAGDFETAGNHFDKGNNSHPHHSGDLPSLRMPAGDDKVGAMLFVTDAFTLADLLADDGTAVIIHAGADNFGNIPQRYGGPDSETLKAGDSGPRTGCGVIRERSSIPQFDALLNEFDVSLSLDGMR